MDRRFQFYKRNIDLWIKNRDASVLIVGGGDYDFRVFRENGFQNVTISNLDSRMNQSDYLPYKYAFENAENLSFNDDSFDYVVVHASLHHCSSPHSALLNMYRVARKSVILFESRDSFLMNLTEYFGFTETYEHSAVYHNNGEYGGVDNSDIPNFVYRWTEREIEKTIKSYSPYASQKFKYSYDYDLPRSFETRKAVHFKKYLVKLLSIFYIPFKFFFPRQQNLFACKIDKPDLSNELFEWLNVIQDRIEFNKKWGEKYYKKN